jgi:hypothetical protein
MDEITLVTRLRDEVPLPDDLRAEERRLLAEIRAPHTGSGAGRERRLPRGLPRLGRRAVLTAAFGLAGALALTMTQVIGLNGNPPVRQADAAEILEAAARAAEARAVQPRPGPHQWIYTRTFGPVWAGIVGLPSAGSDADTARPRIVNRSVERWERFDGRKMAGYCEPSYWCAQNGDVGKPYIDTEDDRDPDEHTPRQYYDKLRKLPTDPEALLAYIRGDWSTLPIPAEEQQPGQRPTRDPDDHAFSVIKFYLREGAAFMPPRLEASLFRALAKIPGVEVKRDVTDVAGRRGIEVSLMASENIIPEHRRMSFILEPGTYRYLAGSHALLAAKVVDKAFQRR